MFVNFVKLWKFLRPRLKKKFVLVFILVIISAIFELLSVVSIFPFLYVLNNPTSKEIYNSMANIFDFILIDSLLEFNPIILFGLLFISVISISAFLRVKTLRLQSNISAEVGNELSCSIFNTAIVSDYENYLSLNSSYLISSTTLNTIDTVFWIHNIFYLISSVVISIGISIGIIIINRYIALLTAFVFIAIYIILALYSKEKINNIGIVLAKERKNHLQVLQHGLGAFRDIYLQNQQDYFSHIYSQVDRKLRVAQAEGIYMLQGPKFKIEAIGISFIAFIALLIASNKSHSMFLLPILGSMALGAQRLLPSLQQTFQSWGAITQNNKAASIVLSLAKIKGKNLALSTFSPKDKYELEFDSLEFNKISYLYPKTKNYIIRDISLKISPGEVFGVVGPTGSGKSTLIDLLVGLLRPTSGNILINGNDLHSPENYPLLMNWRRSIRMVPQDIYLLDASIASNIAFGIDKDSIDFNSIEKAAELANIKSFIDNSENGYDTYVGERGLFLSGGQRQRIAIARALYQSPSILVLDEATSALDINTEEIIINNLLKGLSNITIIIITHRPDTLKYCNDFIDLGAIDNKE